MQKSFKSIFSTTVGISLVLSAVVELNGCSTTAGVEVAGKTSWNEEGARGLDKKVIFNSSSLKGDVEVTDLRSVLAGDLMKAQVTIRSKDKDTLSLQYRFEWFETSGVEINSGAGSWKPLIVYGKESKTIQAIAPDPRAKEFKVRIRTADE